MCVYALFLLYEKDYEMKNKVLEFDQILEQISEFALSQGAKKEILSLKPLLSERHCNKNLKDTTEAKQILENIGNPPIATMKDLDKILDLAKKGAMLSPENLSAIANFIYNCKRISIFLKKSEHLQVNLAYTGMAFIDLEEIQLEIETSVKNDEVCDHASKKLSDIRRKIENARANVKLKLDALLKSKREFLSDGNIVSRNGRFVLPVKKEYKNQVSGTIVDTSSKGTTVFIEPSSVAKLQSEISSLEMQEDLEINIILYTLSALIDDNS